MKIVVFGATGSVGKHVVGQALSRGYSVTAFTRDANKVTGQGDGLWVVHGDVTDPAAVRAAVAGQDAVIVTLGAGRKGRVREAGTRAVVQAMERESMRRLVCQSTLGVGDSRGNLNFLWKYVMFGLLLRAAFQDHVRQEGLVRPSRGTPARPMMTGMDVLAGLLDGPRARGAFLLRSELDPP